MVNDGRQITHGLRARAGQRLPTERRRSAAIQQSFAALCVFAACYVFYWAFFTTWIETSQLLVNQDLFFAKQASTGNASNPPSQADLVREAISFKPRLTDWMGKNYLRQENPPLFSLVADKLRVKDWLSTQSGLDGLNVAKVYWNSSDANELTESVLKNMPKSYVVKVNHASGSVVPVKNGINLLTKKPVDLAKLRPPLARALGRTYSKGLERWYSRIKPQLFIEEFIDDESGDTPHDFKFHAFHQKVVLIQTDSSRFGKHNRHFYNIDWERLGIGWATNTKKTDESLSIPSLPKPSKLTDMIRLAETLAKPFVYVRVDLYVKGDSIYFGELTFAHEAGQSGIFRPAYVDNVLGFLVAHPEHIQSFQRFTYPKKIK